MKSIFPVIKGDVSHITGETARFFVGKKPVEVQEIQISNPIAIPEKDQVQMMSKKECITAGLYSASGVPLFDINTGFPLYKINQIETEVQKFKVSGDLINTVEGFIPFNYFNVSVLKEYLKINDVNKQHLFLHKNRFEIQQAHRYEKLHQQYTDYIGGKKKMTTGALINYSQYDKNSSEFIHYFDTINEVKDSLNTKLSPYLCNMFNYNFSLNDQQLLYEMPIFMSLIEHIDSKDFIVYILKTKFKSNEHDIRIINNITNKEFSVQLKTMTSTNKYLMDGIKLAKERYKGNTNILVVSSSVGQVIEVLETNDNSMSQSIFNLNKKFESPKFFESFRIYFPDCSNVQKVVDDYHKKVLEAKNNIHNEIKNIIPIDQNIPGVSNEPCIKPSSIKKKKK